MKKLFNYFRYRKIIRKNSKLLDDKKIRIDKIGRLYTVLYLNEDVRIYGNNLIEKEVSKYTKEMDEMFTNIGLVELIGLRKLEQIDMQNYLYIFDYNGFDTEKTFRRFIYIGFFSVIIIVVSLGILFM